MRRLGSKRKRWLDRRVRAQWLAAVKAAVHTRRTAQRDERRSTCVVLVPRLLIAEKLEQRQQILDVLEQIQARLQGSSDRVKVDFSRVEKIFPGGMLIFLATLVRLAGNHPGRVTARCPPQSLAGQLIHHFGLAGVLGVSEALSKPRSSSVVGWSYLSGNDSGGVEVKRLLDSYGKSTNAVVPEGLFAALTEGLTNVRHHAYNAQSSVPHNFRKWWLFARYDEPNGKEHGSLFVSIYDMGVGIPATMRNKLKSQEVVLNLVDKAGQEFALTDGTALDKRLLEQAVEHKRSQTGHGHRGNGLPEMREFANSTDGGRLHIVSGHAQYSFCRGKVDGHTQGFKEKFPGTLLLWSLPLKAKELSP